GEETADKYEERHTDRGGDNCHGWLGDFHAQRDEKQGDEKIADIDHLCDHVDVIREGRNANAGNERSHLSGKSQPIGGAAYQKAPGKRRDQQKLRNLGDEGKKARQHVSADCQGYENQSRTFYERLQKGSETGIVKVWLQSEESDCPNILTYEN